MDLPTACSCPNDYINVTVDVRIIIIINVHQQFVKLHEYMLLDIYLYVPFTVQHAHYHFQSHPLSVLLKYVILGDHSLIQLLSLKL